jgi:capsular polysaccharide biosynthesis protein
MRLDIDRNDDWYESEESTRRGMVQELQRVRRRMMVKPWPVLLLTLLITGALTYKLATRKQRFDAEVVLALREGSLGTQQRVGMPVGELKEFVASVLLPDKKLEELIERRNLHRLRKRLGMNWAVGELRQQMEIEVWRNSYVYYDPDEPNVNPSARIGITVSEDDPDDAYELAHDLASIVMQSVRERRLDFAGRISASVSSERDALSKRLAALELDRTETMVAFSKARRANKEGLAQALNLRLTQIDNQQKDVEKTVSELATSQDAIADRIATAGLDLVIELVGEKRPNRPPSRGLLISIIAVIVGIGSLIGTALVLGAFDSRVHDAEDVERLGLPVLGHVPGFPGDRVGSLEARGVQRNRVPSFRRWRSQR